MARPPGPLLSSNALHKLATRRASRPSGLRPERSELMRSLDAAPPDLTQHTASCPSLDRPGLPPKPRTRRPGRARPVATRGSASEEAEASELTALLRSGAAFFDSVLVRRDGKQAQGSGRLARPASAPGRRTTSRGSADDSAARSASAPVPTTSALSAFSAQDYQFAQQPPPSPELAATLSRQRTASGASATSDAGQQQPPPSPLTRPSSAMDIDSEEESDGLLADDELTDAPTSRPSTASSRSRTRSSRSRTGSRTGSRPRSAVSRSSSGSRRRGLSTSSASNARRSSLPQKKEKRSRRRKSFRGSQSSPQLSKARPGSLRLPQRWLDGKENRAGARPPPPSGPKPERSSSSIRSAAAKEISALLDASANNILMRSIR